MKGEGDLICFNQAGMVGNWMGGRYHSIGPITAWSIA